MSLTIAYTTNRKDPHIEWFYMTLNTQLMQSDHAELVIVDFFAEERKMPEPTGQLAKKLRDFRCVPPKPSLWQGPHRKTRMNFFSAGNARNTALALVRDPQDWIAYVDDCSWLGKYWMDTVRVGMRPHPIDKHPMLVAGSYQKIRKAVLGGDYKFRYEEPKDGFDYRLKIGTPGAFNYIDGRFFLGCTTLVPVYAYDQINGWPEQLCDGMGYEDCITGVALQNCGYHIYYNRDMMIYEASDIQEQEPFLRIDPGTSPNDKSHAMWKMAQNWKNFPQAFGEGIGTIPGLRRHLEITGKWPVPDYDKEWFTQTKLEEFHHHAKT